VKREEGRSARPPVLLLLVIPVQKGEAREGGRKKGPRRNHDVKLNEEKGGAKNQR